MSIDLKACPLPRSGRIVGALFSDERLIVTIALSDKEPVKVGSFVDLFPLATAHVDCDSVPGAHRRTPSPAVLALVEACKGLVPTLRSGDWGNQDETANEIDEALAAVEREIGGA